MPTAPLNDKSALRAKLIVERDKLADRGAKSESICQSAISLPEFQNSSTIFSYIDVRSEVRTRSLIAAAHALGKRIVVPYCEGQDLALFIFEDFSELEPGSFGILEPRTALRKAAYRHLQVQALDLAFLPAVAFEPCGTRLGYGKGYFDRLFQQRHSRQTLIGLAFESQIVPQIPREPHDVRVDVILTESMNYDCRTAATSLD